MIFQREHREQFKKDHPNLTGVPAIAKKMGEIWRGMNEKEKQPYNEKAEKDKQRYEREMEEYNKKKAEEKKKK